MKAMMSVKQHGVSEERGDRDAPLFFVTMTNNYYHFHV
ncbi:hypothetical protein BQ6471_01306 [Vibrio gazogenes]|nr:hypothetical protein BQ6471_01306 [Vibrio gazogenes]